MTCLLFLASLLFLAAIMSFALGLATYGGWPLWMSLFLFLSSILLIPVASTINHYKEQALKKKAKNKD